MNTSATITLFYQHLTLLAERAIYWQEKRMLVVADPHFGKAHVYRNSGIPIPPGTTARDLERLSGLLDQFHTERLLFLGDLLHGRLAHSAGFNGMIDRWRRRHDRVQLILVKGNHDDHAGNPPPVFRFDHISTEIVIGPFQFIHAPTPHQSSYILAGHLHPAVAMRGKGRLKETLPCFCFGSRTALLPAFGSFTGNQVIRPGPDDRVFVIAEENVIEIPMT